MDAKMSVDLLSRLPVDIVLNHVLSRLNYVSWVRAGTVSSSWNSLASQCPPPLGDSIPWIWLSDGEPTLKLNAGRASYPLIITSAIGRRVDPNRDDYMLVSFLLDHRGTDIDKVLFLYTTRIVNCFLLPIAAAALFCPDQPTIWVAAAVAKYDATASDLNRDTTLRDLIFHKGELYCINQERQVVAFDVSQNSIQPPRVVVSGRVNVKHGYGSASTTYFLVESLSGGLLVVEKNGSRENPNFTVHRVDKEEEGKLVPMLDLGDDILFVGGGCSRSILHGSRARDFPFFTRNCIYFFEQQRRSYRDYDRYSVGKFSIENNNVVYCEYELLNGMMQPIWIPSNLSSIDEEKMR